MKNKGISLISLTITIIVIILLAAIAVFASLKTIEQAEEARFKNALSTYKEELEFFIVEKQRDIYQKFERDTLMASKTRLSYNTMSETENGNIYTVIPSLEKKWEDKFEIIKGELLINTFIEAEMKWAKELDINTNPYKITDEGVLESTNGNLLLVGESGKLTVPDYVTSIAQGAFANVEGLKEVVIPGNVKRIESGAFAYNTTLESVILEDGVEYIGSWAFQGCSNLKNVEMTNSVKEIGSGAFYYCNSLTSLDLSNNIKTLRSWVICGCRKLTEFTIPNGVEKVQKSAFTDCSNLETIIIPESVTDIEEGSLAGCIKLENIIIDDNNTNFTFNNGVLLGNEGKTIIFVLNSNSNVLVIPEGVVSLAAGQLRNRKDIDIVQIPKTVTKIASEFTNTRLDNVIISPENPNYMSYNGGIYTKDGKTLVKYYAKDTNVVLEEGLETIGYSAFAQSNAVNIVLPDSLKVLEDYSLGYMSSLTSLSLGKNISELHPTFMYGSAVVNLTIDSGNPKYIVENNMVMNKEKTKLITLVAPIGSLKSYEIPYGITEIGDLAFHNQYNLKEIIIPETVTKIGKSFNYCSFEKIEIPSSVKTINSNCFGSCKSLKEIILNVSEGSISGSPWGCPIGKRAVIWKNT